MFQNHLPKAFRQQKLLLTNVMGTCVMLAAADTIQQHIDHYIYPSRNRHFDARSVGRFGIMGLVMGPMSHYWYLWLEGAVTRGSTASIVTKKIILDVVITPAFGSTFVCG
ncbi:unnamed protein product [Gongylonema pulchrum]|uniref:PXMP2/4 family protein 2 n=1 Tax=Gongylonema pulchrum TaxID=637853 RepID=A0A183DAM0_9BILA|nr:unnamed protein product [Gongylonema pulchrum]